MKSVDFEKVISGKQIQLLVSLAQEIWREYYPPIIGLAQVEYMLANLQSADAIKQQIEREGFFYFLIVEEEQPIGYLGFVIDPKKQEIFISKFYIKKSHRHKGAGKKALQFMESFAHQKDVLKLGLMVCKKNIDSIQAYGRMGFQNVGPIYKEIGGGFVLDDFKMEKMIA